MSLLSNNNHRSLSSAQSIQTSPYVAAFRNMPPRSAVFSFSSSYYESIIIIPLLIAAVCFVAILGLYFLLYAGATIRFYFPNAKICGISYEFSCLQKDEEHRRMWWRILTCVFLIFVSGGIVIDLLVLFGGPILFQTFINLLSSLNALNVFNFNMQDSIAVLQVNINEFTSAQNSQACTAALQFVGVDSSINGEVSLLSSGVDTLSYIISLLIYFVSIAIKIANRGELGSRVAVYFIISFGGTTLALLAIVFLSRSRRYLTLFIVIGLFIVSIISIIHITEILTLVSHLTMIYYYILLTFDIVCNVYNKIYIRIVLLL